MSERISRLQEHIQALNAAGVRRTTYFPLITESLRETAGRPRPIRRALAFAHLLDNVEQVVLPFELLAGSVLGMWPLAEGLPGYEERRAEARDMLAGYLADKRAGLIDPDRVCKTRWALMARDHYDGNIEFAQMQGIISEMQEHFAPERDLSHLEIAREIEWHFNFDYGEETRRLMNDVPWVVANHLNLDYGKAVERGLGDIRAEIEERLAQADGQRERAFYESTRIALDATVRFIGRYADTLNAEAARPGVPSARSRELEVMAEICARVATAPPEGFREALQLVWLLHIVVNIGGGSAMSFGLFDRYMRRPYEEDIESGRITPEMAKDLLACMWLKVNEPKMRTVQSVCLAGLLPDGSDNASELTRLCLEVSRYVRTPYPNTSVRLHEASPEWLLDEVVATVKCGHGQPMVLNDDMWVGNFVSQGVPLEDAREYYNMGCVEMMIHGKMPNWGGGGGAVDFPGILELVLRNGGRNMAGQTGAKTGSLESLKTFDQFLEAFLEQVRYRIRGCRIRAACEDEAWRDRYYDPFASIFIDDCLESGRDVFQSGARYGRQRAIGGFGLGTAADSLAAIRKFVYEDGALTLEEMADALTTDFKDRSELRAMLEARTPRYGNDDDGVDEIARILFDTYADSVHALNDGSLPGMFCTSVFSYNHHVYGAENIEATPDGRHRAAPMSDAIGPSQGRDIQGPTNLINSVTKLDHRKVTGAYALNVKFAPRLVQGPEGSAAVKALIRTYLEQGGVQMQINFVDAEALKDAQIHPERHGNLVVRVAGYSEYFTSLDRELQCEIIRRTAHAV